MLRRGYLLFVLSLTLIWPGLVMAQQSGDRLIWAVGLPHGRVQGPLDRTLLQAWVSDADFHAIPGAAVTFVAPDQGDFGGFVDETDGTAGHTMMQAVTDSNGVASAWFQFGLQPGPFLVNAVVDGTSELTNFSFTNEPVPIQPMLDPAVARQAVIIHYQVSFENPQLHGPFLLEPGTVIRGAPEHDGIPESAYTVDRESWFFYIDELPAAAWGHPVRFVLLDANTLQPDFDTARVTVEDWFPRIELPDSDTEIDLLRPLRANQDLGHLDTDPNAYRFPPLDTTFRLAAARMAPKQEPNACAIAIHGPPTRALRLDSERMETFFKDKLGIPAANVFTVKDDDGDQIPATPSQLSDLITKAKDTGCKKLFLFIAGHGTGGTVNLADEDGKKGSGNISYSRIAELLKPLGDQGIDICVILQPCSSGNAIQPMQDQGFDGYIVTASGTHGSTIMYDYVYGSFFVDKLVEGWQNDDADTNHDGVVDLPEAFAWTKQNGGYLANYGGPMSSPIVGHLADIMVPDINMDNPGDTYTVTIHRPAGATGALHGVLRVDKPEIASGPNSDQSLPGITPIEIPEGSDSVTVTITAKAKGGTPYFTNLRDPLNVQYTGDAFILVGSGYTITPNPVMLNPGEERMLTITRDEELAKQTGRVTLDIDPVGAPSVPEAEIFELSVTFEEGELSKMVTLHAYHPGTVTFVAKEHGGERQASVMVTVLGEVAQACTAETAGGTFDSIFNITSDKGGHGPHFGLTKSNVNVGVNGTLATIFGENPNAGLATGVIDLDTCTIPLATGTGVLAGFPGIEFEYRNVVIDPVNGTITGEYVGGTNHALPPGPPDGQPIYYQFEGVLLP